MTWLTRLFRRKPEPREGLSQATFARLLILHCRTAANYRRLG